MISDAYQRAANFDAANFQADPENRLLWRRSPRRIEAGSLRDAILAVAGNLNLKAGGPPIFIPLTEEEMSGVRPEHWPATTDPESPKRRSLYLVQKRNLRCRSLKSSTSPIRQ
jgi:hypothetical protein